MSTTTTAITPLDDGLECLGPLGGRHHHRVDIAGEVWTKGDSFFALDRHGVPRPMTFQYYYAGNSAVVCFNAQRFRRPRMESALHNASVPVGFIEWMPSHDVDSQLSPQDLAKAQLVSDLLDVGLDRTVATIEEGWALLPPGPERARLLADARSELDALEGDDPSEDV